MRFHFSLAAHWNRIGAWFSNRDSVAFQLEAWNSTVLRFISFGRVAPARNGHLPKVCFFASSLPVHSKIGVRFFKSSCRSRSTFTARFRETRRDEARRGEARRREIFRFKCLVARITRRIARKTRVDSARREAGGPRAIVLTIVKDKLNNSRGEPIYDARGARLAAQLRAAISRRLATLCIYRWLESHVGNACTRGD